MDILSVIQDTVFIIIQNNGVASQLLTAKIKWYKISEGENIQH